MTDYFFDSSALVKRYIPEQGSAWIIGLHARKLANKTFIADITPIEIISAVARRKREGTVSARAAKAIRLMLNRHLSQEYIGFALSGNMVQLAMDLQENHTLRAYDSVQLATAVSLYQRLIKSNLPSLIFVSADTRLLAVAMQEGLTVDNPNNH